jgi:hypothetical protein
LRPLILIAIWLAAAAALFAEPPVIGDLEVDLDGDVYVASARLQGGLTPERVEEIEAGLETTIAYRLNIYRVRAGLPNPSVSKLRIECTVQHDALTRQYTLTRRIDGELQEKKVTPDDGQMREFMTFLERLPVATAEEILPGESHYIKARADLGLVWRFYMIPWRQRTPWMQVPIGMREANGQEVSGDEQAP